MVPSTPGITPTLNKFFNLRLSSEQKERDSQSQIPQQREDIVTEEGVPGPPPAFWNGHLVFLLNVKKVPVQEEWRGEEGPEGLLHVSPCSLQESLLDDKASQDVEKENCN